jgi:hypothetical protein
VTRPGGLNEASDLDVAIEGALGAEDFFALWRDLERAVDSWPVDLVELDRRDVHFAQRIRHLFRGAYRMHLDPDRLAVVRNKAMRLRECYEADIKQFIAFLDAMARLE